MCYLVYQYIKKNMHAEQKGKTDLWRHCNEAGDNQLHNEKGNHLAPFNVMPS